MDDGAPRRRRPLGGILRAFLALILLVVPGWWTATRLTAPARRLEVRTVPAAALARAGGPTAGVAGCDSTPEAGAAGRPADEEGAFRLLAWNIAHGRGDVREGWRNNWRGGSAEDRTVRLAGMLEVLARADADVVVLNEVDFDAAWSHGLNQAEVLARAAGYPFRVEQRNYDFGLPPLRRWAFGNALLSRFPVEGAQWVRLPPHSALERVAIGAKAASAIVLRTPLGPVAVVPVHLEVRGRATRLAALPALDGAEARLAAPLLLAGDFNSAPSRWPGAADGTLLDSLLARGWRGPRALAAPAEAELTFPSPAPRDARDWILAEAPLRIVEERVLAEAGRLSDHLPVLATVALEEEDRR